MLRSGKGPMVVAALTLGIVGASSAPLDAAECPNSEAALEVQLAGNAQDALSGLLQCIASLREEVSDLRGNAVPVGVVVASVKKCGELKPAGRWVPFEKGDGRMIVGVGSTIDESKNSLEFSEVGKKGGNYFAEIRPEHLPPETLQNGAAFGADHPEQRFGNTKPPVNDGDSAYFRVKAVHPADGLPKEGRGFNNMPPFVALHFCERT